MSDWKPFKKGKIDIRIKRLQKIAKNSASVYNQNQNDKWVSKGRDCEILLSDLVKKGIKLKDYNFIAWILRYNVPKLMMNHSSSLDKLPNLTVLVDYLGSSTTPHARKNEASEYTLRGVYLWTNTDEFFVERTATADFGNSAGAIVGCIGLLLADSVDIFAAIDPTDDLYKALSCCFSCSGGTVCAWYTLDCASSFPCVSCNFSCNSEYFLPNNLNCSFNDLS